METIDRSDGQARHAESPPPDLLRALRPEIAPCIACGQDRGGLALGTPCPECGERSPPTQSLVLPAKREHGSRTAYNVAVVLYSIAAALALASRSLYGLWVTLVPLCLMVAMRKWRDRATPRLGYGFSVGGVTVGNVNGLVRLPWSGYQAVESRRGAVRLVGRLFSATVLRGEFDAETTRQIAGEIERYRLRSREFPGSSIGSPTLAAIQLCGVCGACRQVAIGGACAACGEPMPSGTQLLSGRSSPSSSIRTAVHETGRSFGIGLIVALPLAITLVAGSLSGEWLAASLIAGTLAVLSLIIALALRSTVTEPRPRLRDARDRHWLLGATELRVITSLGDDVLPWDTINQIERIDRRGRWTAVRASTNDPRLRAETIWLADERDVETALGALRR